jgi:hypothetical protein
LRQAQPRAANQCAQLAAFPDEVDALPKLRKRQVNESNYFPHPPRQVVEIISTSKHSHKHNMDQKEIGAGAGSRKRKSFRIRSQMLRKALEENAHAQNPV